MIGASVIHIVLVMIAICLAWSAGFSPTFYTLQLVYYLVAMSALLLGLGWMTSSTSLFVRDVTKVVSVIVQFGFWLTPIFWNINMVPESFHWVIKLNPMYYIITGYRDSIVTQVPFWERDGIFYFWGVTLVVMFLGISVYRKLRPHFAEVV